MTVTELSKVIALEIRNIALDRGMIGAKMSVTVTEPDARLQITLRPRSILIRKVREGGRP
jgi:hypothetical protein